MTRKQKRILYRIIAGTVALIIALLLPLQGIPKIALFLIAYGIVGSDVLLKALRNLFTGQVFDENFLMTIATVGAFFIGEFPEGVSVMLFYQIGELFQDYAVHRSRKSIASLMDIRPDYANIMKDGTLIQVDPEEIVVGDHILVKAGEKIPLDGLVIEGESLINTSALTGESLPREVQQGSTVLSGSINQNGTLTIEVTKKFEDSTVSKILNLVENASSKKAKTENFITRFARYYTPFVVFSALALALIPPFVIPGTSFSEWVHRALIFLVISCPCALVISVPLSFFGGIGAASKSGILVKGSNYLEALAHAEIVVFDKTGTLTKGSFLVTDIEPTFLSKEGLLEITALAESYSNHPISLSLKKAYGKEVDLTLVSQVEELHGLGLKALVKENLVHVGNQKLMKQIGISLEEPSKIGTLVHVALDKVYAGYLVIADEIKEDAKETIKNLKNRSMEHIVMLTGDNQTIGEKVANELGIDKVYTQLLPDQKVTQVENLLASKSDKGKLVFVGDGINDAPVLTRADIGVAMGGLGSDAAMEAADIVIMTDEPSKLITAIDISKKTLSIVKQNIVFALGIKGFFLLLGGLGYATMWEAVFADVGVSVLAILNAMRALKSHSNIF